MTRTTFITLEVVGPSVPWQAVADAQTSGPSNSPEYERIVRLRERADTLRVTHRSGVWSEDALRRLANRSGAVLRGAYWMGYSPSHGFGGAAKNPIV